MQANNTLFLASTSNLTMTSRDIAEVVQSRHSDVCLSIERLMKSSVIEGATAVPYTHPQNGQIYNEYRLDKRSSIIVVAQLCPEFTAALVDRWAELEAKGIQPAVNLSDAASLRNALLGYTEKVMELEAKVEEQAPKAAFHDAVVEAINCQTIADAAKVLGTGQNRLFKALRAARILMANNVPYQKYLDNGYFKVIERQFYDFTGESRIDTKTLVTGKGLAYIQRFMSKAA